MYKNSHFVFVRGAKETGTAPKDFWVARILQVRAKSAQQVYALVSFLCKYHSNPFADLTGGLDVLA